MDDKQPEIEVAAETFKLLGDPTRLKILVACLSAPMAVGDIAHKVEASPSLVSHHLRLLRGARLVRRTRQARQMYYEAADHHIEHVVSDMIAHAGEHDGLDDPDP
ncbi:ArsR/SmtB family transcription factor [Martelella soudanensis]|uniref:ArsR/SmtB family transcription factor n=1 Tax=unclassified Martelella TaxID=2629616 RepID=UPI0015E0038D|nr:MULTISPECIES: metalloregulator ArsR/SmtB family transcription factor [unclassified Martelella]